MIISLLVGLILCAVFLLYGSNKHQHLYAKPLPKYCKWLGFLFISSALYIATLQFSGVAVLLSWLMMSMLCLVILPSVIFFSKVKK
ncbi:hypothetical protein BGP78_11725 [Pseudoalteromonas sp. MSK9-3]|nr:hypothetical protein BGP78_11725 [Pseudoalteromonas sp. MSK9-3]